MQKIKTYWVSTKHFCGAIAVDEKGLIYAPKTAPYYKKMHGKSYRKHIIYLKRKNYFYSSKRISIETV